MPAGPYYSPWERVGSAIEMKSGGPWDPDGSTIDRQMYEAVVNGEVRCRLRGELVSDLSVITSQKWHETNRYALPRNLEVHMDDVERIWDWNAWDMADVIALGRISSSMATNVIENVALNLRTLYRMLESRLRAMPLEMAMADMDFETRWEKQVRDFVLLRTVPDQNPARLAEVEKECAMAIYFTDHLVSIHKPKPQPAKRKGRRPTFDWIAARNHIFAKFDHHGDLAPEDPEWGNQADVEREVARFFDDSVGRSPAISAVRAKVKQFISEWRALHQH